jgi:hypothetical protein
MRGILENSEFEYYKDMVVVGGKFYSLRGALDNLDIYCVGSNGDDFR